MTASYSSRFFFSTNGQNRIWFRAAFARPYCLGLLLASLLTVGQGGNAWAQDMPVPRPSQIDPKAPVQAYMLPFTPLKGYGTPIVRVRLNDQVEANFLVDTGTTVMVVSSELVKKLSLPIMYKPVPKGSTSVKPETQMGYVNVKSISAGGLNANGECVIWDELLAFVNGKDKETKIDGIIGTSLLSSFAVVLDFERSYVFLILGGKVNDAQLDFFGLYGVETGVPMKNWNGDKYTFTVPVSVEGKATFPALIDTGMPQTLLLDTRKQISLPPNAMVVKKEGELIEGPYTMYLYPTSSFGTGETSSAARWNNLFPFIGTVANEMPVNHSFLGINYLSHFRVVLDYPAQRLYVSPVSKFDKLFPTEASRQSAQERLDDLRLIPSAEGEWSVVSIEKEGLYSKAGVQAGDVFEQINGEKADGKTFYSLLELLYKKEGTVLQIIRGGKTVTIEVKRK